MATGKDEAKPVVIEMPFVPARRIEGFDLQLVRDVIEGAIEASAAADTVDGFESACRHQPCVRISGDTVARPLLHGRHDCVVQRFFGHVEISEEANQGGENATRLAAINRLQRVVRVFGGIRVHCQVPILQLKCRAE
jgi:hypothetical protein